MKDRKQKALLLICLFVVFASFLGIFLSGRIAELGLLFMPALYHLYPIITIIFVVIYSVIVSRKILWFHLIILLFVGLFLECVLFWITKTFPFSSQKFMAIFILFQLIVIYGGTWFFYFFFTSRASSHG